MFEEKNALPRAELQPACGDRDHFARARQDGTNVRSAVVAPLGGMLEPRRLLRHELLEEFLEVAPRGRVGIFHDNEAATGVPNEHGDGPVFDPALRHGGSNLVGEVVSAFAPGRDRETGGVDWHEVRGGYAAILGEATAAGGKPNPSNALVPPGGGGVPPSRTLPGGWQARRAGLPR